MPESSYISSVIRDSIPAMPTNNTTTSGTNTTLQNIVPYDTPPLTIILTVTLLVFFLAGFFSVYFFRCLFETLNNSRHLHRSPSGNNNPNAPPDASAAHPGLDLSIIESFPMFVYSDVKDMRKGKGYDLECAICLCEFEDDDSLRLLPSCCHVFHQDCIDLWLKSHKTCPVCRKKLDATPSGSPLKCPLLFRTTSSRPLDDGANEAGSISITIRDDDDELGAFNNRLKKVAQNNMNELEEKFSRSHSTGHSIVKDGENRIDKYTLELPDDDFHSIIRKGHHCTRSCTAIEEYSNSSNTTSAAAKKTCCSGFGEVVTTSIRIDGKLDDVSLATDGNDKSSNLKNAIGAQNKDGEFRGEISSAVCDGYDNDNLHSQNSSASSASRNSVVVRFSDVNDNKV